jgi:L-ribulose-5-phosphate 3-epimerase
VRIFGGRWGTIQDFRELMAQHGNEPPLEGYSYQQGIDWNVVCIQECIHFAKEYGITIAIENHWGLTFCAEGVLDIIDGVGDELKVALDCGNFRDNTYAQLEALIPYTVLVHIKTYWGGGLFYDFNLHPDYARIIQMLRRANYMGFLSIEYEGKLPSSEGIPQSINLLKELT